MLYGFIKNSEVPFEHAPIHNDIKYGSVKTVGESESNFRITTDIPYITLPGEP